MLEAVRARIDRLPPLRVAGGTTVLAAGTKTGRLVFLETGWIGIVRDGVTVTRVRELGAAFGEMSLLLDVPHSVDVVALDDSTLRIAEGAAALLLECPGLTAYVATVLAHRLDAATRNLVDVYSQFADAGSHLGMIDEVLDSLASRHPTALRARPSGQSTAPSSAPSRR